MDTVHERCAAVDVSKTDLKVCLRVPGRGARPHREVRTFGAMTHDLLQLRDWLLDNQIAVVGMEATGTYWKPLYYLLEATEGIEPWLLNAHHVKAIPRRKTDVKDSRWLCDLVEHNLVRRSFVPPRDIRRLRDLTRYRTEATRDRTRNINRLSSFLEDTGIKLSAVVSDILGVGPRRMLEALVAGERDPETLSDLALRGMRNKIPLLNQALSGHFNDHHAFMVDTMLRAIDDTTRLIDTLSEEISRQLQPFQRQIDLLITIPGIQAATAAVIIAEIGAETSVFPTAGHLASWAGMCPGNNQSGARSKNCSTTKGDAWLKGALGNAAAGAARVKGTYLHAQYRHLIGHRGKQRARVAVGHSMIVSAWHILHTGTPYRDLGPDHFTNRAGKDRKARRLISELRTLGYTLTVTPPDEQTA